MTNAGRVPAQVFPIGEFVREEMEAHGWGVAVTAAVMGCKPIEVTEMLAGKKPLSVAMAERLGRTFGTSAQLWLNLDAAYRKRSRQLGEG